MKLKHCRHGLLEGTCAYCEGYSLEILEQEEPPMTYVSRWESECDNDDSEFWRLCSDIGNRRESTSYNEYSDSLEGIGVCCTYCDTWFRQVCRIEIYTCPCCHRKFHDSDAEIFEYDKEATMLCELVDNVVKDLKK